MITKIKDGMHIVAIDDAPHQRENVFAELFFVYCKSTYLEKVTHSPITVDGTDSTRVILNELQREKKNFSLIVMHGITVGGLNIVDIHTLSDILQKPILAVTENAPTDDTIYSAIDQLSDSSLRKQLLDKAGPLESFITPHSHNPIYFHTTNVQPEIAKEYFIKFCIRSRLPEQLLIAHKIASAWI